MDLSTPALLFSATSLILLAYTNRFLTIATLIRNLKKDYINEAEPLLLKQIKNLNKRVSLIRWMQLFGVMSLFFSVFSMLLIYLKMSALGVGVFVMSLIALLISLALSAYEINISVKALQLDIKELESN